jgi:hypothetical protein
MIGNDFSITPRPVHSILQPSYSPDFPRQGLSDIIRKSWHYMSISDHLTIRYPIFFVHASPGSGKVSSLYIYLYLYSSIFISFFFLITFLDFSVERDIFQEKR